MNIALLVLRIVVGLTFAGHGAQKLFGTFGGPGIDGTAAGFDRLRLHPARPIAIAVGSTEAIAGVLLAVGLLTTPAAAALIAVMTAAIITVHLPNGFWNTDGGIEFNLTLIAAVFALAGVGAGSWSLDNAFGIELTGTGWALAALAAGVIAGAGAVVAGRLSAQRSGGGAPRDASAHAAG